MQVTVGDYAAQAIVIRSLQHFGYPFIAEEDSATLASQQLVLDSVVECVRVVDPAFTPENVLAAIDCGLFIFFGKRTHM